MTDTSEQPIYTLKQWYKKIDKKTQTQLFEPEAILRDWGRSELIFEARITEQAEYTKTEKKISARYHQRNNSLCSKKINLEVQVSELQTVINRLVALKIYKDTNGIDLYFIKERLEVWTLVAEYVTKEKSDE